MNETEIPIRTAAAQKRSKTCNLYEKKGRESEGKKIVRTATEKKINKIKIKRERGIRYTKEDDLV